MKLCSETFLDGSMEECCYLVTKHSWKGKYRRVLSLSKDGLSTHNPGNMEPTNTWKWSDVINVAVLSRHFISLHLAFFNAFMVAGVLTYLVSDGSLSVGAKKLEVFFQTLI